MSKVHNRRNMVANVEATGMVNVDLTDGDYDTRNPREHFGIVLAEAGTVKLKLLDGTEDAYTLPAGWNPVAAVKIYKNGTLATGIIAYY